MSKSKYYTYLSKAWLRISQHQFNYRSLLHPAEKYFFFFLHRKVHGYHYTYLTNIYSIPYAYFICIAVLEATKFTEVHDISI